MSDTFRTISDSSEGEYKEKGSKFISFAIPAKTTEDVKNEIEKHKRKFYDARHICYAYVLGAKHDTWRAVDDGEPSGTAGKPILGQINSHSLTNTLIIVVRYFGGVLLGTGGLTTAYKEAARDALQNSIIIEEIIHSIITIKFEYTLMNNVMRIVKEYNARIISQNYENDCEMCIEIRELHTEHFTSKLIKIDGVHLVKNPEKMNNE